MKPKIKKPVKAKKTIKKVIRKTKESKLLSLAGVCVMNGVEHEIFIRGDYTVVELHNKALSEMAETCRAYEVLMAERHGGLCKRIKHAISYFFTV